MKSAQMDVKEYSYFVNNQWRKLQTINSSRFTNRIAEYPLWPETVHLLKVLLSQQKLAPNEIIFRNRYGEPLSASGVRFRLRAYLVSATQKAPRLATKRITPHTFRQASAYYTTFQSPFILKTIGLGQVQSAAVYGRSGLLRPEPAQLAIVDPFER
jgi:integrase